MFRPSFTRPFEAFAGHDPIFVRMWHDAGPRKTPTQPRALTGIWKSGSPESTKSAGQAQSCQSYAEPAHKATMSAAAVIGALSPDVLGS